MSILSVFNTVSIVTCLMLFASAPFLQRCRVGLAYLSALGLGCFVLLRLVTGVDLEAELAFYSFYHRELRNILIHVVFVPAIVWSVMVWLAYVPLPSSSSLKLLGFPVNFAHVLAGAFSIFHVQCDPLLGSFASAVWWAMAVGATWWIDARESKAGVKGTRAWAPGTCAKLAGAVHVLSWYMQLHVRRHHISLAASPLPRHRM